MLLGFYEVAPCVLVCLVMPIHGYLFIAAGKTLGSMIKIELLLVIGYITIKDGEYIYKSIIHKRPASVFDSTGENIIPFPPDEAPYR